MGYTIQLEIDTGEFFAGNPHLTPILTVGDPIKTWASSNQAIYKKALGFDIKDLNGMTAWDAVGKIKDALVAMYDQGNLATWTDAGFTNQDIDQARDCMESLLLACAKHPKCIIAIYY